MFFPELVLQTFSTLGLGEGDPETSVVKYCPRLANAKTQIANYYNESLSSFSVELLLDIEIGSGGKGPRRL